MAFRTKHRVHSQGYIVYITKKSRKAEYSGCSNEEMRKLLADGVEVNEIVETPEIAYTGNGTLNKKHGSRQVSHISHAIESV